MSNSFWIIFILCLASMALMVTSASVNQAPNSQNFIDSSPKIYPGEASNQQYLEACANKITEKCGEEIFTSIFKNGTYTNNCCRNLVSMGKECHSKMVKFIVNLPEYNEKASTILAKSEQVWNNCALVAASPSSAPSPSS